MKDSKIFFSYTRLDSEFAIKLATDLREAGADIWMDQLDIRAGSRWDVEVEKALHEAEYLLVILSPDSINSNNVSDEISFAIDEGKKVVPVLLKECRVPFRIRRIQYADFTSNYERGFNTLLKTFSITPVAKPKPEEKVKPVAATPLTEKKKTTKQEGLKKTKTNAIKPITLKSQIPPGEKRSDTDAGRHVFAGIYIEREWLSDIKRGVIEFMTDKLVIEETEVIDKASVVSVSVNKFDSDWLTINYKSGNAGKVIYIWSNKAKENSQIRQIITGTWGMNIQKEVDNGPVLLNYDCVYHSRDRKSDQGREGKLSIRRHSIEYSNSLYKDEPEFKSNRIVEIKYLPAGGDIYSNYIEVKYKEGTAIKKVYLKRVTFLGGFIDSPTLTMYQGIQQLIAQKKFIFETH